MRASIGASVVLVLLVACDKRAPSPAADATPTDAKPTDAKPTDAKPTDGPIDALTTYRAKSMAIEAKVTLKRLESSVTFAYEQEVLEPGTATLRPPTLPPSAPLTPPPGTCCALPDGTCPPDRGEWDHAGWTAIDFRPHEPHRYSYEMVVADSTVTLRAVGDLDCDGELSTYESVGTVTDGALKFSGELRETSPLE